MRVLADQTVHVQTDWTALGIFLVSLLGIIGGVAKFLTSRIDKYTTALTTRLTKIDEHLGDQDVKIARIEGRIGSSGGRRGG